MGGVVLRQNVETIIKRTRRWIRLFYNYYNWQDAEMMQLQDAEMMQLQDESGFLYLWNSILQV